MKTFPIINFIHNIIGHIFSNFRSMHLGVLMPKFSQTSLARIKTCDQRLQDLMHEVIKYIDIKILCGHRTEEEQTVAFDSGKSQVKWPNSKHNSLPSQAIDIAPWPIDWNNIERFKEVGIIVKREAEKLGITIEWGGDWNSFKDYPHFQLVQSIDPKDKRISELEQALKTSQNTITILSDRLKSKEEEINRYATKLEQIKAIIKA